MIKDVPLTGIFVNDQEAALGLSGFGVLAVVARGLLFLTR